MPVKCGTFKLYSTYWNIWWTDGKYVMDDPEYYVWDGKDKLYLVFLEAGSMRRYSTKKEIEKFQREITNGNIREVMVL